MFKEKCDTHPQIWQMLACRTMSALSLAQSWQKSGEKQAIANNVDQMALDAYKPALIQEFLPQAMSERHARHMISWLRDHPKRTLEPIAKVSLPFTVLSIVVQLQFLKFFLRSPGSAHSR